MLFAEAVRALLAAGHDLFVEVSPHPVLLAGIEGVAEQSARPVTALGTLRRGDGGPDRLLAALTEAWCGGAPVDWRALLPDRTGTVPVPLPTYPFERDRFWLPTPGRTGLPGGTVGRAPADPADPAAVEPAVDDAPARLAARVAGLDPAGRRQAVLDLVTGHAAAVLGHSGASAVRPERPFAEAGFDSLLALRFRNRLCEATGLPIAPTVVFEHPTPGALADHLCEQLEDRADPLAGLLAELDRLAATLDSVAAATRGTAEAEQVGDRLHGLLRGWGQRTRRAAPPERRAAEPLPEGTETATADELFALLDREFNRDVQSPDFNPPDFKDTGDNHGTA
ncbi:hypothetical protein GXW82_05040 [Streptacidiphilus sp. 4-A2]|nr:hypothetical protein [Streptacidiphilus sp. 4-A2]